MDINTHRKEQQTKITNYQEMLHSSRPLNDRGSCGLFPEGELNYCQLDFQDRFEDLEYETALENEERERKEEPKHYLWDLQDRLEDLEYETPDHDTYLKEAKQLIREAEESEYADLLNFNLLNSFLD